MLLLVWADPARIYYEDVEKDDVVKIKSITRRNYARQRKNR